MKLLRVIKSNNFGLWLAISTVIIQGAHSAYVFMSLSSFPTAWAYVHSSAMALVISGAILYFTLRNQIKLALFFAVFESMINIAYYIKFIIVEEQSWWLLLIAVPVAIVLPVTLYFYAENIKDFQEEEKSKQFGKEVKLKILEKKDNVYTFEKVE